MATDMTVSVIIPTYNRSSYLVEAIDSVMSQTYKACEVLVIDDGSSDDTREAVNRYAGGISYIYQDNKGPSAARNNGIRNAKGDLIAFLDSDDIWHPEKLEKQVAVFVENPSVGLIATGYVDIDTRYEPIKSIVLTSNEINCAKRKELYKNFFATSSVMVQKTCFYKAGLFNEELHFAEDWEMWIRILEYYSFDYIPELLMQYRVHPINITSTSLQKNMIDWMKVIDMHSGNRSLIEDAILRRKRISWLHLNHAIIYRNNDIQLEILFMVKSILSWPIWFPRRYSTLLKTLWRVIR